MNVARTRWIIVIPFLIIIVTSCTHKSTTLLEVKGTIKNIDKITTQYSNIWKNGKAKVFLYEIPFGNEQPVQLDSTIITQEKTSFALKGKAVSSAIYIISIEDGPTIPVINDGGEVVVDIDFGNKEKYYSIKGSPATAQLRDFIFEYSEKSQPVNKAMGELDSLQRFRASDSLVLEATNKKNAAIDALNVYLKNFLAKVDQPVVATFALGRASQTFSQPDFDAEINKLATKFPKDHTIVELKKYRAQALTEESRRKESSWVGKKAPDLSLPDPYGKNISISSFKGKWLLVDFWASWCRPCRIENPAVVGAFNKYKNKNFTILGVSLDRQKENWLQAIQEDHLTWTHVSDLAFWNSKAVSTFGFTGIPYNVLIDPQGTVIAESLRGEELVNKLNEVLK